MYTFASEQQPNTVVQVSMIAYTFDIAPISTQADHIWWIQTEDLDRQKQKKNWFCFKQNVNHHKHQKQNVNRIPFLCVHLSTSYDTLHFCSLQHKRDVKKLKDILISASSSTWKIEKKGFPRHEVRNMTAKHLQTQNLRSSLRVREILFSIFFKLTKVMGEHGINAKSALFSANETSKGEGKGKEEEGKGEKEREIHPIIQTRWWKKGCQDNIEALPRSSCLLAWPGTCRDQGDWPRTPGSTSAEHWGPSGGQATVYRRWTTGPEDHTRCDRHGWPSQACTSKKRGERQSREQRWGKVQVSWLRRHGGGGGGNEKWQTEEPGICGHR